MITTVKLNFDFNKPTQNNRLYPKELFTQAFDKCLEKNKGEIPVHNLIDPMKPYDLINNNSPHVGYVLSTEDYLNYKIRIIVEDLKLLEKHKCPFLLTTMGIGENYEKEDGVFVVKNFILEAFSISLEEHKQ